ncbi:MAG: ABC transporter ATP-binding protein [Comamonadaceae bacterium]|nr:MAG: ABC transporter ATP-binding protein [Comamonadaceae bacterium]
MAHEHSVEVRNLAVRYGIVPALRDVSLVVRKGQIVTIIGANGAGKSTLMKAVSGLLTPAAGSVTLFGEDVTGLSAEKLVPRGLSLVPEGRRLFGAMTVRENLELGAYSRSGGNGLAQDLERTLSYFPDLRGRLSAEAGTLSGGQQQMVAVGRALMSAPRILLLDEPTIGLAPAVVETIAGVIATVRKDGVDVILVEQNAEVALAIADYGYVLEEGHVVMQGDAADLARNEDVKRAYLGI